MLNRPAVLLASLAALVGLHEPLCEVACTDPAPQSAMVEPPGAAPRHEEPEHRAPAPGASHEACGCASLDAALLASTETPQAPPGRPPIGAPGLRLARSLETARLALEPPREWVPAPDVLLLTSTLLL